MSWEAVRRILVAVAAVVLVVALVAVGGWLVLGAPSPPGLARRASTASSAPSTSTASPLASAAPPTTPTASPPAPAVQPVDDTAPGAADREAAPRPLRLDVGEAATPEYLVLVVDPAGRPVPDATVTLDTDPRRHTTLRQEFVTDESGLTLVRPDPDLRTLWAEKEGQGCSGWTTLDPQHNTLTAVLQPPGHLAVTVPEALHHEQRTLELRYVQRGEWRPRKEGWSEHPFRNRSRHREGEVVTLTVDAPAAGKVMLMHGRQTLASAPFEVGPGGTAAITLDAPTYTLTGVLRDPAGRPVAGAAILTQVDGAGVLRLLETHTKGDGTWTLRTHNRGRYTLAAQDHEHITAVPAEVTVDGSADWFEVEIELVGPQALSGQVVWPDDAPVPRATVELRPSTPLTPRLEEALGRDTIQADGRGVFSFPAVSPALRYDLRGGARDMVQRARADDVPPGLRHVVLEVPGDLAHGVSLEGTVRHAATGQLLEKARVHLEASRPGWSRRHVRHAGNKGTFHFEWLAPWTPHRLRVETGGHPELLTAYFVPGPFERRYDLWLGSGAARVWIENTRGRPLPQHGLRLYRADDGATLVHHPWTRRLAHFDLEKTGAQGMAHFADVPPGSYWLTSFATLDHGPRVPPRRVEITDGAMVTWRITAEADPASGALEARLLTMDGELVDGADLGLKLFRDVAVTATTDARGVATWEELPAGVHEVRGNVSWKGRLHRTLPTEAAVVIPPGETTRVDIVIGAYGW